MSTVQTRNTKARNALTALCKRIGYPTKSVKKLGDEWYILHLTVKGGAMIELQTGGEGSTTVYWETIGAVANSSGEVSFADAKKVAFTKEMLDLAKSIRRPTA